MRKLMSGASGPALFGFAVLILISALVNVLPMVTSGILEAAIPSAYADNNGNSNDNDNDNDNSNSNSSSQSVSGGYCDCTASSNSNSNSNSNSSSEKVIICHKPGSSAQHTISISASAEDAHLDHGDSSGVCPGDSEADALVETGEPCTCTDGSAGVWVGSSAAVETPKSLREIRGY